MGRLSAAAAVASVAGPARRSALAFAPPARTSGSSAPGWQDSRARMSCERRHPRHALRRQHAHRRPVLLAARVLSRARSPSAAASSSTTSHKTMLATRSGSTSRVEDVDKVAGRGLLLLRRPALCPKSVVVDEYREFVAAMRDRSAGAVAGGDGGSSTRAADVQLDRTNLLEYLEGAEWRRTCRRPVIKEAIIQAYIAEYGLAPDEQSCLNFLLFIHADRRSKFTPFGVFSDERWHVLDGNDRIATGSTTDSPSGVELGMALVRVRRTAAGAVELTFQRGTPTIVTHPRHGGARDSVHACCATSSWTRAWACPPAARRHRRARVRHEREDDGGLHRAAVGGARAATAASYADLPNIQTTWETNPDARRPPAAPSSRTTPAATRGANSIRVAVQAEAARFLADLESVYPGASAAATRAGGQLVAHLEHWPSNPLDARQLHLLPARTVHDDRRPRGQARREPVLRRRARQLVLRMRRASWKARRSRESRRPPACSRVTRNEPANKIAACSGTSISGRSGWSGWAGRVSPSAWPMPWGTRSACFWRRGCSSGSRRRPGAIGTTVLAVELKRRIPFWSLLIGLWISLDYWRCRRGGRRSFPHDLDARDRVGHAARGGGGDTVRRDLWSHASRPRCPCPA